MDLRGDISDFLRTRRARITPEQAGLGAGGARRVPGLRREEVAVLASISVHWYVRIERGNLAGVSDEVVDALARALQLDDAETAHLYDLARAAHDAARGGGARGGRGAGAGAGTAGIGGGIAGSGMRGPTASGAGAPLALTPGLQAVLDSMQGVAAWVRNHRFEILGANPLARALYSDLMQSEIARGNNALFTFLDPAAREFYRDWEKGADDIVAVLRGYAGANPGDARLTQLIGELATRSPEFSKRWARHDVKLHRTGTKRLHHRAVGDLTLSYEALTAPASPGLNIFVYSPVDEPTRERLQLLDSWWATESAARESAARASAGDATSAAGATSAETTDDGSRPERGRATPVEDS
ncbi:helix-turn-helix transcriptional regulator [Schumannella sp. 10F1B-5-1]|uniref:helix-turn-helix transcriptional regulator n=1 Tax=Schumannella sp. 10F1B-5-1 TaxID=2590780 RepID=UPI00113107C3|nr:helix-turn-helix transcriptional regulator [Schumannella sp. 10F1B-5-1]TPW76712.1 helix-turn-helix domain-containing protein [Schumannella sp. 10F1B-5-1]